MFDYEGKFDSRDYDGFERMELIELLIHNVILDLKIYSIEIINAAP